MGARFNKKNIDVNYWFPCEYRRGPNILVWIALICCFITVLIKLNVPTSISRWPETITTLLFLHPLITQWSSLKKNNWIKLWALAIVCPLVFFVINYLYNSELAIKYASFNQLARIYLFIPIAWWLGGSRKAIATFLCLAMLGFFFAVATSPEFLNDVAKAINGKRVNFSVNGLNWQQASLFFSLCLIGSITYLVDTIKKVSTYKPLKIVFLSTCVIISILGITATQTRAAYLGLILCLLTLLIINTIELTKHYRNRFTRTQLITAAIIFISITVGAAKLIEPVTTGVVKRVFRESNTLTAVIGRDWENIPYNSAGIRINTWIQGAEWIKEKPLIGYGGNVRTYVIQSSKKHSEFVMNHVGHFHNSFIEIMLAYGLIGTIIAFIPLIYIPINYRQRNMKVQTNSFFFYGFVLFFIMNLFESYLFFWTGPYILTILLSFAPIQKPTFLGLRFK